MSDPVQTTTSEHEFLEMQTRIEELEAENAKLKDALNALQDRPHRAGRKPPPPGSYL